MSLYHGLWENPDASALRRGREEAQKATDLNAKTPRERGYIAAIHAFYSDYNKVDHRARAKKYSDAMEKVYKSNPNDHEAAIFYALSLLASDEGETSVEQRKKAAAILEPLARDHQHAVAAYGVFGTPTFVFSNGASAYIRLADAPTGAEAVRVFDSLVAVAAGEPGILEIKRPVKPSPD